MRCTWKTECEEETTDICIFLAEIFKYSLDKEEIAERRLKGQEIYDVCTSVRYRTISEIEEFVELLNQESDEFYFTYEKDWFDTLNNDMTEQIKQSIDDYILEKIRTDANDKN